MARVRKQMEISYEKIRSLLENTDIEGLIEAGAPADEYDSEAQALFESLARFGSVDEATINEALSSIWMEYFGLSSAEITKRLPAIQNVANYLAKNES